MFDKHLKQEWNEIAIWRKNCMFQPVFAFWEQFLIDEALKYMDKYFFP